MFYLILAIYVYILFNFSYGFYTHITNAEFRTLCYYKVTNDISSLDNEEILKPLFSESVLRINKNLVYRNLVALLLMFVMCITSDGFVWLLLILSSLLIRNYKFLSVTELSVIAGLRDLIVAGATLALIINRIYYKVDINDYVLNLLGF